MSAFAMGHRSSMRTSPWSTTSLLSTTDSWKRRTWADCWSLTRSHDISHIIVEQKFGVEKLVSSPDSEFARRHLRQIWNKNAVSVFEVHQNPLPRQEFEVANYLIDRMMESKIESSAGQAIYHPNNYRDVHRLFPEPRFCILTFDQFEVRNPCQRSQRMPVCILAWASSRTRRAFRTSARFG